jgi:omega-amidase
MKVTLIQTELYWEDEAKNLTHFERLIASINEQTDLIVLPEMFTTGFSMNPKVTAKPWNGEALKWLIEQAQKKTCTITGTMAVEDEGFYYNRLFWVEANGNVKHYNKRHLFRMAKEEEHYRAGETKIIMQINDWNICPLICYDLRFPVWSRNHFDSKTATWDYDVLMYVANWPEVRSYPWKQLLIARAIENQCYVIGLNRIGKDGNGVPHSGDSMVINPRGEIISSIKANENATETVKLDWTYLEEFRKTFPVGLDADEFKIV